MLQRVMIDGIELPRLYIAENSSDANLARAKGIPFVCWNKGPDALIKMLLRPVLEKMFPHIKWDDVLGRKRKFRTNVTVFEMETAPDQVELADGHDLTTTEGSGWKQAQESEEAYVDDSSYMMDDVVVEDAGVASGERLFSGSNEMLVEHKLDISEYIGDMSSYVNIDILQRLRLMPAFIGNILDCVRINIGSGLYWSEGYNKRLGLPVGRFDSSPQLPNLIILDVSGSIPRGISATMISLIDTLRTQLSADLIITAANSRFYPMGSELPDPQRIRDMFGYNNEAEDFFYILDDHIKGHAYGHVFSFGDDDTPEYFAKESCKMPALVGTMVRHVHHYHTGLGHLYDSSKKRLKTGYAKWCHMLASSPMEDYDTDWASVLK